EATVGACLQANGYFSGILGIFACGQAPMYGLARCCQPCLEHGYPVASMYQACSRKPRWASGQHRISSRYADYRKASRARRSLGIDPRRSELESMLLSRGWSASAPRWQYSVNQLFMVAS